MSDRNDLVRRELQEELNVTDLIYIKSLGGTLSNNLSIFGNTEELSHNYYVETDLSFNELVKCSSDAIDCYENEEIFLVEGDYSEFSREMDTEGPELTSALKSLLDGEDLKGE